MRTIKSLLFKNFISIYFAVVFLGAATLFTTGYIQLSNLKKELVNTQQAVSEINLYSSELKKQLVERVEKYESSTRGKITWQIDDDIRLRVIELKQILINVNDEIIKLTRTNDSLQSGSTVTLKRLIEQELFAQEQSYLSKLHELARARYNFDWLSEKYRINLSTHTEIYKKLQENEESQKSISGYSIKKYIPMTSSNNLNNEHAEIFNRNQNAASVVENNRVSRDFERDKIIQLQGKNSRFTIQEAKIQNLVTPLYTHIYDTMELIESNWITKIFKPVFGFIPLLAFILFLFIALTSLTQLGFGYLDQQVASTESNPADLKKITIFLIVLCCIPALMILAYKLYQQSEHSEAEKRRDEIISDLIVKIDNAQKAEEIAIRDCASTFAGELSALKEQEENIGKFTEEVLSLKAQWSALKDVSGSDEYQKRVASNFSKFIISPDQLELQHKRSLALCLKDIESIENKLFVSIGATHIEQNDQEFSRKLNFAGLAESIGRVASVSKSAAFEKSGTMITTTAATFITTFNPLAVIAADVAVNITAEKVSSAQVEAQVKKEIDNISAKELLEFSKELTSNIRSRNDQLKKKLGAKI